MVLSEHSVRKLIYGLVGAHVLIWIWAQGASSIRYAVRPIAMTPVEVAGACLNMVLNFVLLLILVSLPFVASLGLRPFAGALAASLRPTKAGRLDAFLATAAFGPMALVLMSSLFDIQPRPLWMTQMIAPLAAWCANACAKVEGVRVERGVWSGAVLSAMMAAAYAAAILVPIQTGGTQYANIDHRELSRAALAYWKENGSGELRYLVTIGGTRALHAAGSLAFDLPEKVHVFVEADPRSGPWIELDDLLKHGALVIGSPHIPEGFGVNGTPVVRQTPLPTPVLRGRAPQPLALGIIEPKGASALRSAERP